MARAIGNPRFVPHVVLHETETWVLAGCDVLGEMMGREAACAELKKAVDALGSPELVNDGPDTAPSKRIIKAVPRYSKTMDGPIIVSELGVEGIRAVCPHADERLSAVEAALGL